MDGVGEECVRRLTEALRVPMLATPPISIAPMAAPLPRRLTQGAVRRASGNSCARWYAAMCAAPRAAFEGFAVMLHGRQVDGDTSTWHKACALADRVGGQVAIWTSGSPHTQPDDGGNVGSEEDDDKDGP